MTESQSKFIIVNADDFGLNSKVNQGIIRAHQKGIVTSASLMVRQPATLEAVTLANENPNLSIGLHLDLGEWFLNKSEWRPIYEVVDTGNIEAVAKECERQILRFQSLMGRMPSHIDSHQHVHNRVFLRPFSLSLEQRYVIPVRHCATAPSFCGDFYGQGDDGITHPEWITPEALCRIIQQIDAPITEICCHPSLGPTKNTMYSEERIHEEQTLCDPRVRMLIETEEIKLCNFDNIRRTIE